MGSIYGTVPRFRTTTRNRQVEQTLHKAVVAYIRRQYPGVLFRTDGGGLRLTKNQAVNYRKLQHGPGWPDLFIAYPSQEYHGLFIELKQDGTSIYKKIGTGKGQLVADEHIRQQHAVLAELERLGYCARFGIGLDHSIALIDGYMGKIQTLDLF